MSRYPYAPISIDAPLEPFLVCDESTTAHRGTEATTVVSFYQPRILEIDIWMLVKQTENL